MPHNTFRTRVRSWMTSPRSSRASAIPLHLATIVADGEIALHEHTKLGVEAKCASFAIAEELLLDGQLGAARSAT
jgi:hypothetical protein